MSEPVSIFLQVIQLLIRGPLYETRIGLIFAYRKNHP